MQIRLATIEDYAAMHAIRMAVRENVLSNPESITIDDYQEMIESRGRGWICEIGDEPVGFAVGDLGQCNIWALFVRPGCEGRGIGRGLHDVMVEWMFANGAQRLWLSTDPGTRAERFYVRAGWQHCGVTAQGEAIYELLQVRNGC
jgi:GNAT superfamily N-acetyltransferase